MTAAGQVAQSAAERVQAALTLLLASLHGYVTYDPQRQYTPHAREPYDALCDRFVRCVETSLHFFRAVELTEFGEASDTTRDLLNGAAKLGFVSEADLWLRMRLVRNQIVHEYRPERVAAMYADITGPFGSELRHLGKQVDAWVHKTAGSAAMNEAPVRYRTRRNKAQRKSKT